MQGFPILSLLTWLPIAGGVLVLLFGDKRIQAGRWLAMVVSGTGAEPLTLLRARLASCLAAVGVRPTIGAISSKGTPNMSCRTNASRSSGSSVPSTTNSARPTESARSAACSGCIASPRLMTGSGR